MDVPSALTSYSLHGVSVRATTKLTPLSISAMSSYLFIIKYELPEVIRAFMGLEENTGYVLAFSLQYQAAHSALFSVPNALSLSLPGNGTSMATTSSYLCLWGLSFHSLSLKT